MVKNRLFTLSPLLFSVIWLIGRIGIGYFTNYNSEIGSKIGVFLHLILILLILLFGLIQCKKKFIFSFLPVFKKIAKNGMLYSIFASLSVFSYYYFVSSELQIKRNTDYTTILAETDTQIELNQIKKSNPQLAELNRDQLVEQAMKRTELFTNPKNLASLSFFTLTLTSLIYSLFGALLYSKFLTEINPQKKV